MPTSKRLDPAAAQRFVDAAFSASIVETLTQYIRIPNKSQLFDPDWQAHGHMDRAIALFAEWAKKNGPSTMKLEVVRAEGRTPLLLCEIPGSSNDTVLLYGHLDKQPEMEGWREGLGPFTPVLEGDRLYGRGGADDGYALFAALTAITALEAQGIPHARCVLIIEAGEESGSPDLPYYVDLLADRIGKPSLVVCLDSGCGNYDQLWCTTSLRGVIVGELRVRVLKEGVHSGDASGVVPSTFRIARTVLDRIEDSTSGEIKLEALHTEIPSARISEAKAVVRALGATIHEHFPFAEGVQPVTQDLEQLVLNRTWRPTLCVTGASGLPALASAGNVLRPETVLKLSIRLPPRVNAQQALEALRNTLEADPPYGAIVRFQHAEGAAGWDAPATAPWLEAALQTASKTYFGREFVAMGEGGSIPFMGMLGAKFPEAQFVITGVLGPGSNAHGPNEFLDLPTAKRITCCIASILADHHGS